MPGRNEARVSSRPKPNTRSEEKQTQLLSDYVIIFVETNTAGSVSKQRSPTVGLAWVTSKFVIFFAGISYYLLHEEIVKTKSCGE